MKSIKLSIIIVHYKVTDELFKCLKSIIASKINFSHEIIIVDNDEKKTIGEELKKKFHYVTYIKSPGNIGFGAGNNLGEKYAKGEHLFFLNPDTIVFQNSIDKLIRFLGQNHDTAIVAPLLLDPTSSPYPFQATKELTPIRALFALSFVNKIFPENPISQKYWITNWDKKSVKEVDVVPGTAFMIRRKIFEEVGRFDEKFFMYYEESDLCKRVRKLGYKIYMLPDAKIIHAWGSSTKKSKENIHKIFSQSQFYYFKKHYGLLWAILTRCITSLNKEYIIFLFILTLGIFLRMYRIEQNFPFDGEIGDNLLDIKNAFIHKYIPLKGPPTSHSWLSFGPFFYWIYGPILILAHFNPLSHAYLGLIISILIIICHFYFTTKLFYKSVGYISTYLIAISPLYLFTARLGRFTFIVALLIYPYLWFLKKIIFGEKRYFFQLCFLLGVMLNFHYTTLVLIPFTTTIFFIKKVRFSFKEYLKGFIFFLVPLSPLLLYSAMHDFEMIKNLFLWIPYRIAGFFGLYPKNTFTQNIFHENTVSFFNFFSKSFFPIPNFISFITFGTLVFFVIWKLFKSIYQRQIELSWLLLLSWGFWGFLALFIHGSPPLHYFVPLLPFPIIVFSFLLEKILNISKKYGIFFILVILFFISFIDIQYYFSHVWFYIQEKQSPTQDGYISYNTKTAISKFIIKDAQRRRFLLKRVGYNDQFEKQSAQNYIYLLWYYGNEPVSNAKLVYTIVEQGSRIREVKKKKSEEFDINNVAVLRDFQ